MESALRVPGAFPVDAVSQFALATAADRATTVDGIGAKAVCVFEPQTTPPSTTLVVLLSGGRLYRATEGYASCDTLKQFAQAAIGRIGASPLHVSLQETLEKSPSAPQHPCINNQFLGRATQ